MQMQQAIEGAESVHAQSIVITQKEMIEMNKLSNERIDQLLLTSYDHADEQLRGLSPVTSYDFGC